MLRFNRRYFSSFLLLLITEILIALYVRDSFVRPYVGDYLVVMLIYCFVCSFLHASKTLIAVAVLLFSYSIEGLQYLHIVNWLGLQHNVMARTVIGVGFEWRDLLAYTLGIATTLLLERINNTTPL